MMYDSGWCFWMVVLRYKVIMQMKDIQYNMDSFDDDL